jgi:hypothetical protein
MPRAKLTDSFALGASSGLYWDTHPNAPKGFGLCVSQGGSRSWVLNYRRKSDGKERRLTIGSAAAWPVAEARKRAAELRREVDIGGDPLAERSSSATIPVSMPAPLPMSAPMPMPMPAPAPLPAPRAPVASPPAAVEPLREPFSDPKVLGALDRIHALLEGHSAALAVLQRQRRDQSEHGPMILRRLTDLERAVRGPIQDIGRMPRATRRHPLT